MKPSTRILYSIVLASGSIHSCLSAGARKSDISREPVVETESTFSVVRDCAKSQYPEGILAFGFIAAVSSPLAPLVGMSYYGSVLYKCQASHGATLAVDTSAMKNLRIELLARAAQDRAESLARLNGQLSELSEKVDSLKANEASRLNKLKKDADQISAEAKASMEREAAAAIRDVYRQMDEIRKVKILVVPDED